MSHDRMATDMGKLLKVGLDLKKCMNFGKNLLIIGKKQKLKEITHQLQVLTLWSTTLISNTYTDSTCQHLMAISLNI